MMGLLCAVILYKNTKPQFGPGIVEFPGQFSESFFYPFVEKKAPKGKFVIKEWIALTAFHCSVFEFYPQDVLWTIKVNGWQVAAPGLPISIVNYGGRTIDLSPFLHPGLNQIELQMEVVRGRGELHVFVSPWDKYSLLIAALTLIVIVSVTLFAITP